jgi:hypothetical protein
VAARPGKATSESGAGTAEMARAEPAADASAAESAPDMSTAEMARTEPAAHVSAATETAPVSASTAVSAASPAARKRVSSQPAGQRGSRSQDDHGLA